MNLAEWLVRSGRLHADNPGLFQGLEMRADYRTFAASSSAIGAGLSARHGIRPGDRVAIFAKNTTEYLEIMWGAWFAGAAIVPINAKLHPKEAAFIIEDADAEVVFVTEALGNELAGHLPDCCRAMIDLKGPDFDALRNHDPMGSPLERGRDDMAWLFYTSGTTASRRA